MKSEIVWAEQSVGYHFHAQLNTKSSFFSDRWIFDSFRFGQVSRIHSTGLKKMSFQQEGLNTRKGHSGGTTHALELT